jgi:hypothetical protein
MFLSHALENKRQAYNHGLMWIAWKLLFREGGFAYIAFGNHSESKKKFVVSVDESYIIINSETSRTSNSN